MNEIRYAASHLSHILPGVWDIVHHGGYTRIMITRRDFDKQVQRSTQVT